jgi:ParB-like chromosome segregation protein Spo0J
MIKKVKISEVKPNPNNPRLIKDDKFKKLVKSIQDFPDMLNVRPIVVNKDMIVLGGNMRLKAIKEAGHTEVAIEIVDWSEEQQKEFIVKDNVGYGEWDWDDLANNWDSAELTDWGLDIPNFDNGDYSDKNKEINIDDIEDSMTINLKYTEEEYLIVKEALSKIASTPEMAIWKLIGNE